MHLLRRFLLVPFAGASLAAMIFFCLANGAAAQMGSVAASRLQGEVVDSNRIILSGNLPPVARSRYDMGPVEDSFAIDRLYLVLRRSTQQAQTLQTLLRDLQDPNAANYHKWLTPEEFGNQFGPADSDIAAITAWLESHGFTVNKVHPSRIFVEFSGNAAQVREAFGTEIHGYRVPNGSLEAEVSYANASEPQVPAAFSSLIAGISPMQSSHSKPMIRTMGRASYSLTSHKAQPQWTYPGGSTLNLVLAPADFAKEYDIPAYTASTNGSGQSIGILSGSNIDLSLVQAYQTLFNLPANLPTVVLDGNDPGKTEDATEAYLDVEIAGSVAPGARVVLYASAGSVLTDPLLTSGIRAVEDNLVSVLSMSYGICEAVLGASGNALYSQLWQEAAAQGITVFVSAGDSGSVACDDFDTETAAYQGLAVNGMASTPYNIAVGGTDFYYSDYAAGGTALSTQLAGYWNLGTSTTPAVSLKQYAPEQVWNNAFGLNVNDEGNFANLSSSTIVAGGGGVSRSAVYPASSAPTGYPKPSWQSGVGVPADRLRDLPDLSLFAATGSNDSFYPICASPGDCVNIASTGAAWITGVGGTSASAPAMAGIQALVNQAVKSSQGQANYVYYALANKTTTANSFHDVTVGENQVPCYQGSANCAPGTAGQTKGFYAESSYLATKGYDLASGLGSVDVANLIKNWSTVAFRPTATTLSITPVAFAHGTAVSVKGIVAPKSGTGTPTGSIALESNDPIAGANGLGVLNLASGAAASSINDLPGGTYQVVADYSGDGAFGSSVSAPVTVTITPESDTLRVSGWALNPLDYILYPLQPGLSLPYGAEIFLDAQPVGVNEAKSTLTTNTPATGSITFTDKIATVSRTIPVPLNSVGVAEWQALSLIPGSHVLGASYAGDASYSASSNANAASITVFRGTTTMSVQPFETSITAGGSVTVDVILDSYTLPLVGTLPTGNVSITLGGQSLVAPWKSYGTTGQAIEEAIVTFTNVPAGILPLSATYGGDSNWLGTSATYGVVTSLATLPAPVVTLSAASVAYTPGQTVTLTGTVTGKTGKPVPSGNIYITSQDGNSSYVFPLQRNSTNSTFTLSFSASQLANGSNAFVATFKGDANYSAQSSAPVILTLNGADFSLVTLAADVPVAIGKSATGTVVVWPVNGFTGAVTITCTAPTGITCKPATAAPVVGNGASDIVTFTSATTTAAGTYPALVTATGDGRIHTAQVLVTVH